MRIREDGSAMSHIRTGGLERCMAHDMGGSSIGSAEAGLGESVGQHVVGAFCIRIWIVRIA